MPAPAWGLDGAVPRPARRGVWAARAGVGGGDTATAAAAASLACLATPAASAVEAGNAPHRPALALEVCLSSPRRRSGLLGSPRLASLRSCLGPVFYDLCPYPTRPARTAACLRAAQERRISCPVMQLIRRSSRGLNVDPLLLHPVLEGVPSPTPNAMPPSVCPSGRARMGRRRPRPRPAMSAASGDSSTSGTASS